MDYCEEWSPFTDDSISDDIVAALMPIAVIKRYAKGHIFFIDRSAFDVYLLLEGTVQISLEHESGRRRVLAFHTARTFIDDAVTSDESVSLMVTCQTAVECAVMGHEAVAAVAYSHPALSACLLRSVLYKLQGITQHLADQTFKEVEERICNLMHAMARQHGRKVQGGVLIEKSLTHELIAEFVGSTRVRVTQSLKSLQQQKRLGKQGKHYVPLD